MLISTAEAARRLNVTPRRILALISAGRLAATKVGRDWLIAESALTALANRKPGNHTGRPRTKNPAP